MQGGRGGTRGEPHLMSSADAATVPCLVRARQQSAAAALPSLTRCMPAPGVRGQGWPAVAWELTPSNSNGAALAMSVRREALHSHSKHCNLTRNTAARVNASHACGHSLWVQRAHEQSTSLHHARAPSLQEQQQRAGQQRLRHPAPQSCWPRVRTSHSHGSSMCCCLGADA